MKTSKKLLIVVAGLVIALLVTSLIAWRIDLEKMMAKYNAENQYELLEITDFKNLDFSGNWLVRIQKGREFKIEVEVQKTGVPKPDIENIQGTLYFKFDDQAGLSDSDQKKVRIMMPELKTLKAADRTTIELNGFQTDSLKVILENESSFTGINNQIRATTFNTSGNTKLHLIDTEM